MLCVTGCVACSFSHAEQQRRSYGGFKRLTKIKFCMNVDALFLFRGVLELESLSSRVWRQRRKGEWEVKRWWGRFEKLNAEG